MKYLHNNNSMKARLNLTSFLLILSLINLFINQSCKKGKVPALSTSPVSVITQTTATSGGNIAVDEEGTLIAKGVCWSAVLNPTTSDTKTSLGPGIGIFESVMKGLIPGTTYHVRAYATNSSGTGYGEDVTFETIQSAGTVTDIDNNVYNTVTIGTQTWMIGNLKTTRYSNGNSIPAVSDPVSWSALTTGAYCYYNNDSNNSGTYGLLYNWHAVSDSRKLAPQGWHIPSLAEWDILVNYLGGQITAGNKLKETGTAHFLQSNDNVTNASNFTALPGGTRDYETGIFSSIGFYGNWWTSTTDVLSLSFSKVMFCSDAQVVPYSKNRKVGMSVRCVKD
jgi:uncharacterized protein (TIGR02145 family)